MSFVLGFHHAEVTIPKGAIDEARNFYLGVLGLTEVEKPEALKPRGGFWIQLGAFQVHIGLEDGVDRSATKAHMAYEVSDLVGVQNAILGLGLSWKEGVKIPGYVRAETRDPFGNRIEFLQRESNE